MMRSFIYSCTLLVLCSCNTKKTPEKDTVDAGLRQRLEEFMRVNDEMDLEKVMDYTYPRLFNLAPREEMISILRSSFENEDVKITLDSMRIDTIFPVFQSGKGRYAKVKYSMLMLMDYKSTKDSAGKDNGSLEAIRLGFSDQHGEENVRVDEKGILRVHVKGSPMVAARDEHSKEWTFANLKEDQAITSKLFSKEVLDKLKSYD
jgi:hypothetical protein